MDILIQTQTFRFLKGTILAASILVSIVIFMLTVFYVLIFLPQAYS